MSSKSTQTNQDNRIESDTQLSENLTPLSLDKDPGDIRNTS